MTHTYAEKISLKKEDIYYCNLPVLSGRKNSLHFFLLYDII